MAAFRYSSSVRTVTVFILALLLADCGGNPLSIKDCKDQYGRGGTAPNILRVSCTSAGSDVRCQSIADNSASNYVYCPTSLDATAQTTWTSSNPSVAVFDQSPGFLRGTGMGMTVITMNYQGLPKLPEALAFFITPGVAAERMTDCGVGVFGPNMTLLSGVQILVEPERGPSQQCLSSQFGQCPFHSLWLLSGSTTVSANKDGFQPWTMALQVDPSKGGYSLH